MQPEVAKRLVDARAAGEAIGRFTSGLDFNGFAANSLIRSAVERQLEIIGEALGRAAAADPLLAVRLPDIPRIVALRNRIIHGYDSVDEEIVWDLVETKVPKLCADIGSELQASGFAASN